MFLPNFCTSRIGGLFLWQLKRQKATIYGAKLALELLVVHWHNGIFYEHAGYVPTLGAPAVHWVRRLTGTSAPPRCAGLLASEESTLVRRRPRYAPSSFLFLLVRHLLLEAMHLLLVASCS